MARHAIPAIPGYWNSLCIDARLSVGCGFRRWIGGPYLLSIYTTISSTSFSFLYYNLSSSDLYAKTKSQYLYSIHG
jgi:hypothetical protein